MNDGAVQTSRELELGASESHGNNRIFVNLRIGKIAQTSNEKFEGFAPAQTKNKDGTVNNFYAKPYEKITGYINDIYWHEHQLKNGTILTGWNVAIDTTKEVYVLGISSKDRPYQRFMNCLTNVDFARPVMFIGFMGQNKKTKEPQKVLLLSQELGGDNKPVWIQPAFEEKWLDRNTIKKLKAKLELTEDEKAKLSWLADGSFNKNYPYIVEEEDQSNGKWDFRLWNKHLRDHVLENIVPVVQAAAKQREQTMPPVIVPDEDIPNGDAPAVPTEDDDIPF